MNGYEVIVELQIEAIQSLEQKAKTLRAQLQGHVGEDPDTKCRLEIIERILVRLYGQSGQLAKT